jgi:hypothetical protein
MQYSKQLDLEYNMLKRQQNKYLETIQYTDSTKGAEHPDDYWKSCMIKACLPRANRPYVGNFEEAVIRLAEWVKHNFFPDKHRLRQDTRILLDTYKIYLNKERHSLKWTIEAMLCSKTRLEEIKRLTGLDLTVLNTYSIVFFDVSNWTPSKITSYAEQYCSDIKEDRNAKVISAQFGLNLWNLYIGNMQEIINVDNIRESLEEINLKKLLLEQLISYDTLKALSIEVAMQRHKLIAHQIAKNAGIGAGTGTSLGNPETDITNPNISSRLIDFTNALENKRILDTGSIAAKNSLSNPVKTHTEAVMDAIEASLQQNMLPDDAEEIKAFRRK